MRQLCWQVWFVEWLAAEATRLLEEGFEAEEVCWHLQRFRADVQQLLTHEALDICDISDADFKTGVCHGLERTAGDAAFAVAQQLRREDTTGNWHFGSILVKRRVLNCAPQCQVLDGVFLQTTACSSNVVRKLLQNLQIGKLAIVVGKLGRLADESGSRSAASLHPKALNKLPTLGSSAEAKDVSFVHRVCTSLLELGVTVVVSAEMVEETVVRVCAEPYGVLVIPNVSMADVEFLARHFGCFLLNRLVDLSENSVSKLCAVVTEVKGFNAEGQGLMISPRDASGRVQLRGYHPTNPVCILCTAMASALCDTLESTFWSTLYRLRNMQTNRKLCIGGCVTEKAIRRRLDTKQLGRCASTFAEAIEELENIVERNLGFSARDGTCPVFDDTQGKEAAIARALGLIELCLFGTLL